MSDLALLTNWPSIVALLLLLFVAALVGPGRRPPPVSEPPRKSPGLDLSLWFAGQAAPMRWPFLNVGKTLFPGERWAGYYERQFGELKRRVRHG